MNVLLVSQCSKRALTETRRILDQFAERLGDRTWQTPITQAGLDTLRQLLRKTARKNTAVACHWLRGRNQSELLWVVGDARQFNAEGVIPTNSTQRDVLRQSDETTWHFLPLLTALAAMAALLHDLGKASAAFQAKLRGDYVERNVYRHEWVSVRLFQSFVGVGAKNDKDWLQRLAACADSSVDAKAFASQWLDVASQRLVRDGIDPDGMHLPFEQGVLPPLAQAIAWLVLTHHRLPCLPVAGKYFAAKPSFVNATELVDAVARINPDWNELRRSASSEEIASYWTFTYGLPVSNEDWRKQASRIARRLQQLDMPQPQAMADPFLLHLARLCLMLGDHYYSSLRDVAARHVYLQPNAKLFANTTQTPAGRVMSQTLDEHLLGVRGHTSLIANSLPNLVRSLPALRNHRRLKKRAGHAHFGWQDKAADMALSMRDRSLQQGGFIINMASTGRGKTLGNARIMYALANPAVGMRCAFAIGLRTLTLQTGRSFQEDLQLRSDELAIQVGGAASKALFAYWEQHAEATGSASQQNLVDEATHVLYEGDDRHPLLQRLSQDGAMRQLLAAPVLACTVDHLTPATESLRGGRQIVPMLRLMSSDLVLDEIDDFDMADMPALTRLVHWAGMLGARVLLSSATLPPALVEGLFLAYQAGRQHYQRHRSHQPEQVMPISCLWVDEFDAQAHDCVDVANLNQLHEKFVAQRVRKLAAVEVRQMASIRSMPQSVRQADQLVPAWAHWLLQEAIALHHKPQNHVVDPSTGKRISCGLVRMANINPLYEVAKTWLQSGIAPSGVRVHVCVYHSQFPLLVRSALEHRLDRILCRKAMQGVDPILSQPEIQAALQADDCTDHLFVVLGSPVTEVGRDHDYDWAVVEPSSMRSIIQLGGRVRRHRIEPVQNANITVLDTNLKALQRPADEAAYCRPGFEQSKSKQTKRVNFHLQSHSMQTILADVAVQPEWAVTAQPRIVRPVPGTEASTSLVALEHARMAYAMLPRARAQVHAVQQAAHLVWSDEGLLWLTGILPQYQCFRDDDGQQDEYVFLPDDAESPTSLGFYRVAEERGQSLYVPKDTSLQLLDTQQLCSSGAVQPWLAVDLLQELMQLADNLGQSLDVVAKRFARVSLRNNTQRRWNYHPLLGFAVSS